MAELNRLFELLCDAEIDFVIVGGFAAVLHGSTMVTRDLDVCAILTTETVEKLRTALAALNPVHRLTPQKLSFLDERLPGNKGSEQPAAAGFRGLAASLRRRDLWLSAAGAVA